MLGDIVLEGKDSHLDQELLAEILQTCKLLRYVNAQAYIRSGFLDENQRKERMDNSDVERLWVKIIGKLEPVKLAKVYLDTGISQDGFLSYGDIEKFFLIAISNMGLLSKLDDR